MSANSALYVGHVTHRRMTPKQHFLRHRVYWLLLDLDEVDDLDQRLRLFSHNKLNLMSLYDRDHGGGRDVGLKEQMLAHTTSSTSQRRRPQDAKAASLTKLTFFGRGIRTNS